MNLGRWSENLFCLLLSRVVKYAPPRWDESGRPVQWQSARHRLASERPRTVPEKKAGRERERRENKSRMSMRGEWEKQPETADCSKNRPEEKGQTVLIRCNTRKIKLLFTETNNTEHFQPVLTAVFRWSSSCKNKPVSICFSSTLMDRNSLEGEGRELIERKCCIHLRLPIL